MAKTILFIGLGLLLIAIIIIVAVTAKGSGSSNKGDGSPGNWTSAQIKTITDIVNSYPGQLCPLTSDPNIVANMKKCMIKSIPQKLNYTSWTMKNPPPDEHQLEANVMLACASTTGCTQPPNQ